LELRLGIMKNKNEDLILEIGKLKEENSRLNKENLILQTGGMEA